MKVVTNLQWPDQPFRRADRLFGRGAPQLVGFDAEWTKNYRIKNGSRPFCYSFVTFRLPPIGTPLSDVAPYFGFKSVYIDTADEEQAVIAAADRDLAAALDSGQLLAGHQVTSDLSVLRDASASSVPGVESALAAWHERKTSSVPQVLDTRYDVDDYVSCESRRLVDVCDALDLDVRQPEINGSMTRVHRRFLEQGDDRAREKLIVLNLRHSLSTSLVALVALGRAHAEAVDVNALLIDELWDQLDYVSSGCLSDLLAKHAVTSRGPLATRQR